MDLSSCDPNTVLFLNQNWWNFSVEQISSVEVISFVLSIFLWLKACKSLFDMLLCMNHTYREIVNTEMLDCLLITQKHLCQDWL